MNQTTTKAATAEHEHCLHLHEGEEPGTGRRYCCSCDYNEQQPSDPDEPRRAGAGELALPWHLSADECDIEDANDCGVFALYADERMPAKTAYVLRAVNNFDGLVEALERVAHCYNRYVPESPTKFIVEMTRVMAHVEEALGGVRRRVRAEAAH